MEAPAWIDWLATVMVSGAGEMVIACETGVAAA